MRKIKEIVDTKLLDYHEIYDKIAYYASTQDFRGIERMYWKLKHMSRVDKLPVIKA